VRFVAVSQRVAVVPEYGERRDCLDQAWTRFLQSCGLAPLLLPNIPGTARSLVAHPDVAGIVLTGGNDLVACGGDAPERDATEGTVLDYAEERNLPVLGVCRGMQLIQQRQGIPLRRIEGHVVREQLVRIGGIEERVNSYHRYGTTEARAPFAAWAIAADGVVEAIRHVAKPVTGIMWHPERLVPFAVRDIALFRHHFGVD
jgi:N5-(cytidine 5'-diphosphoramidyl)-L-glutamine hydrolase